MLFKTTASIRLLLPFLAVLALGCSTFGIGMENKPQTPQERWLGALNDYTIIANEVSIAVDGWTEAIEQGDPNAAVYLQAAEVIEKAQERAVRTIESVNRAIATNPDPSNDLIWGASILLQIVADMQAELLSTTGGSP